jgi:hypothetical protein
VLVLVLEECGVLVHAHPSTRRSRALRAFEHEHEHEM